MGTINFVFRHLFQIDVNQRGRSMSTEFILMFAIGVFVLMNVGIFLTMIEFNRLTDDPSIRKGAGRPEKTQKKTKSVNIEAMASKENTA
jgi:hypothetical protein